MARWRIRWASKTLWFNLLSAVLVAVEMNFRFLQPVLDDKLYGIGAFTIAIVNVVLRILTTQPLVERVDAAQDQSGRG